MTNLYTLLPQDKMDTERAEALVRLGYPAVEPILTELVACLQDMNWPIAKVLAPFLATISLPIVPHIRQVFDTDDEMWKFWVLQELVMESSAVFEVFHEEVRQMAFTPPKSEDEEALQEMALRVLSHYGVSQSA